MSGIFSKPLLYGLTAALATLLAYSSSAILTTPNLGPLQSLNMVFNLNGYVMVVLPLAIGVQVSLIIYGRRLACPARIRKSSTAGAVSGSAASAFFSFFPLAQLSCCGTWLYTLSIVSGATGVGSNFLIQYSEFLTAVSFTVVMVSIAYNIRFITKARKKTLSTSAEA